MRVCHDCGKQAALVPGEARPIRKLDGVTFTARIDAMVCGTCGGDVALAVREAKAFERAIANWLCVRGEHHGESIMFLARYARVSPEEWVRLAQATPAKQKACWPALRAAAEARIADGPREPVYGVSESDGGHVEFVFAKGMKQ